VDARIRILLRIVDEHSGVLQMSSGQIGSLLGLSSARVLRLFNSEVGITLRSHLRQVRMARAAELLRDRSLPIKSIACTCGYTVVNNFYRDFKLVYGVSPKQMRLGHIELLTYFALSRTAARAGHGANTSVASINNRYARLPLIN
jgi:AraC-like DNA-binding protein